MRARVRVREREKERKRKGGESERTGGRGVEERATGVRVREGKTSGWEGGRKLAHRAGT